VVYCGIEEKGKGHRGEDMNPAGLLGHEKIKWEKKLSFWSEGEKNGVPGAIRRPEFSLSSWSAGRGGSTTCLNTAHNDGRKKKSPKRNGDYSLRSILLRKGRSGSYQGRARGLQD